MAFTVEHNIPRYDRLSITTCTVSTNNTLDVQSSDLSPSISTNSFATRSRGSSAQSAASKLSTSSVISHNFKRHKDKSIHQPATSLNFQPHSADGSITDKLPTKIKKSHSFAAVFNDDDDGTKSTELSDAMYRRNRKKREQRSKSWRRTISSDNLMNTARNMSSIKSKALIKMKNKNNEDMHNDSEAVIIAKQQLNSFRNNPHNDQSQYTIHDILKAAHKLHDAQMEHYSAMVNFSQVIHSSIDLGKGRGSSNKNYFGQYLKMMASTTQSVAAQYNLHNKAFRSLVIEPLEQCTDDLALQQCINLKYEYNKIRNNYNNHTTIPNQQQLSQIEAQLVESTTNLVENRQFTLIPNLTRFMRVFANFSLEQTELITNKRVINGYDEFKEIIHKKKNQIQNETITIKSDKAFEEYFASNVCDENADSKENDGKFTKYTMALFHRHKFPPSMAFIMDCFGPLCTKYNMESNNDVTMKFIIVTHNCTETLEKYNISAFPTLLVFVGHSPDFDYGFIGNSEETREEFKFIVKRFADAILASNETDE